MSVAWTHAEASAARATAQRQYDAALGLDIAFDACEDAGLEVDVTGSLARWRRDLIALCLRRIADAEKVLVRPEVVFPPPPLPVFDAVDDA